MSVLWIALQWLLNLVETMAVVAAILAIGAAIAVSAFWLLDRTVSKLAGPSLEAESYDYDKIDAYSEDSETSPVISPSPEGFS